MYPNSSRSAAAQRTVAMGQQATLPISLDLTVLPQMRMLLKMIRRGRICGGFQPIDGDPSDSTEVRRKERVDPVDLVGAQHCCKGLARLTRAAIPVAG